MQSAATEDEFQNPWHNSQDELLDVRSFELAHRGERDIMSKTKEKQNRRRPM